VPAPAPAPAPAASSWTDDEFGFDASADAPVPLMQSAPAASDFSLGAEAQAAAGFDGDSSFSFSSAAADSLPSAVDIAADFVVASSPAAQSSGFDDFPTVEVPEPARASPTPHSSSAISDEFEFAVPAESSPAAAIPSDFSVPMMGGAGAAPVPTSAPAPAPAPAPAIAALDDDGFGAAFADFEAPGGAAAVDSAFGTEFETFSSGAVHAPAAETKASAPASQWEGDGW
jgi:hypothetical protein